MTHIGQEVSRVIYPSARLESLGLPYAGAWLVAPPIRALELHLQPDEFVMATKFRLGIAVFSSHRILLSWIPHWAQGDVDGDIDS